MKLSIITINFRKPSLTLACIASVYKAYKKQFEKNEWEILIVDNSSGDDSVKVLQTEIKEKKYQNFHVLAHKENNGFGGGNNFGASFAKGDTLLFLNNDTVVANGLDDMLKFLESHVEVGILGGPLKNADGSMQSSAASFYSLWRILLLLLGLQRLGMDKSPLKVSKVDWVKGALFMIRKNVFKKLKGFDENIFMYTEDMEFCYRVYMSGLQVWFFPDVVVVHKDQGSSSRSFAIPQIYQGILYFYKKHRSIPEYSIVKLLLQSKAILLISLGKIIQNDYLLSTYEKALSTT